MRRKPLRLLVGPVMGLAVVVIIANLVVLALWTAPRWNERWGVVGASGSAESARQRVEPAVQRMRDTYGRLTTAEEDLDTFREVLTSTAGGSDLRARLVDAAQRVGIELDDADFQLVPVPELGVSRLGMNVPISTTYEAFRGLLDELLELPVFLVVDAINLQANVGGAPPAPGARSASEIIQIDLALSVFLEEETSAGVQDATSTRVSAAAARDAETLRIASRSDDPEVIADALMTRLSAFPPLPVEPESLNIDLERLEIPLTVIAPSRNLFSVVLPPAPPPAITQQPLEFSPIPEPALPVRLVGLLLIDGRWHASLADEGGAELFIAAAGERLPNGVQVVEVGADYVELEFGDQRTRLTLEGSRP